MANSVVVDVDIRFTKVFCCQDGETGNSEPFLWAAWFRVDGNTCQIRVRLDALGEAKFALRQGAERFGEANGIIHPDTWANHGNIGGGMSDGESRNVDVLTENYRRFRQTYDTLLPIPVLILDGDNEVLFTVTGPAIAGCAAVLWEEDNTPAEAVADGYAAFVGSLRAGLHSMLSEWVIDLEPHFAAYLGGEDLPDVEIPEEALKELEGEIAKNVRKAIKAKIKKESLVGLIKVAADSDDILGTQSWYWSSSELAECAEGKEFASDQWWPHTLNPAAILPGVPRYVSHGIWQVFGRVQAKTIDLPEECFVVAAATGKGSYEVNTLRRFRDRILRRTRLGQDFVEAYYEHAKPVAAVVKRSRWLRAGVRAAVWPVARLIGRYV